MELLINKLHLLETFSFSFTLAALKHNVTVDTVQGEIQAFVVCFDGTVSNQADIR